MVGQAVRLVCRVTFAVHASIHFGLPSFAHSLSLLSLWCVRVSERVSGSGQGTGGLPIQARALR